MIHQRQSRIPIQPSHEERERRTKRRSSFLFAISFALSSLDIPKVDLGTGSASAGSGGGDDTGVGRELDAGDTLPGLPSTPLDLRL